MSDTIRGLKRALAAASARLDSRADRIACLEDELRRCTRAADNALGWLNAIYENVALKGAPIDGIVFMDHCPNNFSRHTLAQRIADANRLLGAS